MRRVFIVIGRVLFLVSIVLYIVVEFIIGPITSVLGVEWYGSYREYIIGLPSLVILIGGLNLVRKAGDGIE